MSERTLKVHVPKPSEAPPPNTTGVVGWLRTNLLSSPFNIALTLAGFYLLFETIPPILDWAISSAAWSGETYNDCKDAGGACWSFVNAKWDLFIYGFYPTDQYWRVDVVWLLLAVTFAPQFFPVSERVKKYLGVFAVTGLPLFAGILLVGGVFGMPLVETRFWGGFTLNVVLAFVGIVAALPIGVLLALGRRSAMPAVRAICVGFIEIWRGVPLITVLFMASVMLPLFLPEGSNKLDKLLRAMIGIIMFQSAYMAEVVRGGLQAISKGQYEAAEALGLNYPMKMGLIVLPQALKIVIPGIVNTFIELFKDTTLVLVIGLLDVLASVNATISDPAWGNVATEGYIFAGLCFWIFCFGMSHYSRGLEKKLNTSRR